jgi:succinate dehydrogenase hydrophobic anchor subunit
MGKRILISAFIAVILSVVIRSIFRTNGIHNFFSENSTGQALIYLVIYSLIFFVFKKKNER